MRVTTKTQYAIVALSDLAGRKEDGPVRLDQIAKSQNLSIHYLEQLFRKLRVKGIVKSHRGPGGGYTMVKHPSRITLDQILEAVGEGMNFDASFRENVSTNTPSKKATCQVLSDFTNRVHDFFSGVTLEQVLTA